MFGRTALPDTLPRLDNYAEAVKRYDETIPLRSGVSQGLVPLGDNRRYKRSQMLKVDDKIICRFWRTDVITFKPNGEIDFFVGTWSSPTTLMFLEGVYGDRFVRYKGKMYFWTGKEHYLIPSDRALTVKDNVPLNPKVEYAMKLNRDRMREVQSRFAPFIAYIKSMATMEAPRTPNAIGKEMLSLRETYGDVFFRNMFIGDHLVGKTQTPHIPIDTRSYKHRPQYHVTRKQFFEHVSNACEANDINAMYPMYFVLAINAARHVWDTSGSNWVYSVDKNRIKKYFDELVKFEFNNIFDKEEQPLGIKVADSNAKYFL